MARYGLLIDYKYCTGCHSCEVACQREYNYPVGKGGIQLVEVGPWQINKKKWQYTYIPVPTELCILCGKRVAAGKQPACVQHCQADVMRFGLVEELAKEMVKNSHTVLFTPR